MIACPRCGRDTHVSETRSSSNAVRRRRICVDVSCGTRVTTLELPVAPNRRFLEQDLAIVRVSDIATLRRLVGELSDGGVE